jgi:hypothetical protein
MRKVHYAVLLSLTALFCLFSVAFATAQTAQTITFPAITGTHDALTSFTLSATASSGLTVAFATASPTICTVSGTTASLLIPGVCVIHATQAGNADYSAAPMVAVGFAVSKATQTITFPAPAGTLYAASTLPLTATASSGLTVALTSASPTVCTISGTTASLLQQGTCIVQANQSGSTLYSYAPTVQQNIVVHLAPQTITFPVPAGTQYALTPVPLTATTTSGLPITYASITPTYCTVTGSTAYPIQQGSCFVHASQAGNNVYSVAPLVTQYFTIHLALQTINFPAITGTQYVLGTTPLSATASSGLTVAFASATPAVCTVSGTTASLKTTGDCVIHATQAGSKTVYAVAPLASQSFIVYANPQTITFPAITATLTAATTLPLSATASSGLTVAFVSTTPTVCTVSGTTASLLTSGTCIVQATQAGNANYSEAAMVQQNLLVHLATQAITFPTVANQVVGANITLGATASSGLAVTYTSVTTPVCTISGSTATMVSAGACVIHATQAGSAAYAAAPLVSKSFTVSGDSQTITFNNPGTQTVGTQLALSATATSGLAVSFASTTATICTVANTTATMLAAGTCTIQATQAGNATWAAAPLVSQSFTVSPPAPLTLPYKVLPTAYISQNYGLDEVGLNAQGGSGTNYSFTVNGVAIPTTDTATAIPNGYGLTATNTGGFTLSIGGTPTAGVTVTLNVTVTDSLGASASQTFTVTIVNPNAGYTVSGTIHYSGTKTGWIYVRLFNSSGNCGNCGDYLGTAISAPGSYTIHGVEPGTYIVQAYMDVIGYGIQNASDPAGNSGATTTVINGAVTGADDTLIDPDAVNINNSWPKWNPSNGFGAFSGGAVISYDPINNSSGIEMPSSYTVEYSTDSTFRTGVNSKSFPATGGNSQWIVNGLTNGGTYYFRAAGVVGSGSSTKTGAWSPSAPIGGLIIAAPAGGNAISGKVTFAGTATGPLYTGFYNQSTGQVYTTQVGSKTTPPTSPAAYSVNVPSGSNYFFFGIIDQNNIGLTNAPGEISNTNNGSGNGFGLTIAGSSTTENLDLTPDSASSVAIVRTQNSKQITATGTNENYKVDLRIYGLLKLPVAVELVSASNQDVVLPADVATGAFNGDNDEFDFWPPFGGAIPNVGDTYTLNVTYSDGTSNSTTNTTPNPLIVTVGAVLNTFASPVSPASQATGVSLTPNFSWTDPASASSYIYQFQLQDSNKNSVWQIPGNQSNSNGFASTIDAITWDVDPTSTGDLPSITQLNGSSTYWWSIQSTDVNGNEAQIQWEFETVQAPLTLPASGALGAGEINESYKTSIVASGGSGSSYIFTVGVNGAAATTGPSWGLSNGLYASSNGNTLTISGYATATGTVTLAVTVTDSQYNQASGTYTITIGSTAVGFPVTGHVNYTGSQSGWIYLTLGSCSGCTGTYGTAIQSPGAFTIRGVPPGTYFLNAWMDSLGTGAQNAANPIGSSSGVVVNNAALSGAFVTLNDPSVVTLDASPTLNNPQGYGTFSGGAFISFDPILNNNNGVEIPTSYTLEWSIDSTFQTGVFSKNFPATAVNRRNAYPATGGRTPWIVTGLTNGDTYYFRAAGVVGSGGFAVTGPWSNISGGMTVNAPSGPNVVSGKVTIPPTITPTGPLYVGFWDQEAGEIYATVIASPSNSTANSYSVDVPTGSNYFLFAFLDQNNSGLIGSLGQVSNTNGYNLSIPSVKISGTTSGENLTLPSANSSTVILTGNDDGAGYSGTSATDSYEVDLMVSSANKIPVAVALLANSNVGFTQDVAEFPGNGWSPNSRFWLQIESGASTAPTVGAVYSVQVTYSDGSSETLSPQITAVLPLVTALDLSPIGPVTASNSSNLMPTFTWQYPASPGNYLYQLWTADERNYNTTWSIPNLLSSSNAFTSSVASIPWGTDPTDPGNLPTISSLVGGDTYFWELVANDTNGNRSVAGGSYSPGYTALALPAPNPSSLGPATLDQPYSGSITATGGYAAFDGHIYSINGTNNFWSGNPYSLGDGLYIPNTANPTGSLQILGTPTATGEISFEVYVEDGAGTVVGPVTYTITINNYANVSLPAASNSPLGSGIVGLPFAGAINASGGPGGGNYAWTVNGIALTPNMPYVYTSLSNGDGLTVATSGGNTLWFAGTPTSVNSGISIVVTVTDMENTSDTATVTYTLPIIAGPNGANNKYLSGTYVCKLDGYFDEDGSRWTTLASFQTGGANGVISNGKYDINGRDFNSGEQPGTFTGSYSIGADNNGLMAVNTSYTENGNAKTGAIQYAIALNDANLATTTATEFRMAEMDNNGQHGTGVCYQATTTGVFGTDIFAGNSFVFKLNGENGYGQPNAVLGRFATSGGNVTQGVEDQADIVDMSETELALAGGSYTVPDATNGRSTLTLTTSDGTSAYEVYSIDANRMFMIETDNATAQSADVRKQIVTSYTGNATGSYVTYEQGYMLLTDYTYTYYSMIVQASSSGSNVATVNQMYQDNNGSYKAGGSDIGSTSTTTFDQTAGNNGRATVVVSGSTDTMVAYYFNTGSAFQFDYNGNENFLETGWTEPQTQTTFTDAKVGGDYLLGPVPIMSADKSATLGEIDLSTTSGAITGAISNIGQGQFSWDQAFSTTYAWDTTASGTGTFTLSIGASCAVINSTKIVCTNQTDFPTIMVMEQ